MEMEWAGKCKPLVDGFGLCSPTLWDPADRGAHICPEGQAFCKSVFGMVSQFVTTKLGDLRLAAFKLGLGKIETSSFFRTGFRQFEERMGHSVTLPGEGPGDSRAPTFLAGFDFSIFGESGRSRLQDFYAWKGFILDWCASGLR